MIYILTEYVTLFQFALLVNKHKPECSKDVKFGQCLHHWSPYVMSTTDAQNEL